MGRATQPDAWPTRKLAVGATVATAAAEVWGAVMAGAYPALAGPAMSALVGLLAGLAVGWFVADRPNVPQKP